MQLLSINVSVSVNGGLFKSCYSSDIEDLTDLLLSEEYNNLFSGTHREGSDKIDLICVINSATDVSTVAMSGICTERLVEKYTTLSLRKLHDLRFYSKLFERIDLYDFTLFKAYISIE